MLKAAVFVSSPAREAQRGVFERDVAVSKIELVAARRVAERARRARRHRHRAQQLDRLARRAPERKAAARERDRPVLRAQPGGLGGGEEPVADDRAARVGARLRERHRADAQLDEADGAGEGRQGGDVVVERKRQRGRGIRCVHIAVRRKVARRLDAQVRAREVYGIRTKRAQQRQARTGNHPSSACPSFHVIRPHGIVNVNESRQPSPDIV